MFDEGRGAGFDVLGANDVPRLFFRRWSILEERVSTISQALRQLRFLKTTDSCHSCHPCAKSKGGAKEAKNSPHLRASCQRARQTLEKATGSQDLRLSLSTKSIKELDSQKETTQSVGTEQLSALLRKR